MRRFPNEELNIIDLLNPMDGEGNKIDNDDNENDY
jgi:hypothetical protein